MMSMLKCVRVCACGYKQSCVNVRGNEASERGMTGSFRPTRAQELVPYRRSRAGTGRARARMRNGVTQAQGPAAGGQLPVRIANMKACSESFHFHYVSLHNPQVPSHWPPGEQNFHLPTRFCEDSTVRRSGQLSTTLNRSQTRTVANKDRATWESSPLWTRPLRETVNR